MIRGWREWDLSFGPVSGAAGSITVIAVAPQVRFRGEKVMASDTGSTPGSGTRIMQLVVGQRLQKPTANGSTLTTFFGANALGNGVTWDVCELAQTIAVTVSFAETCTFDMSVFGRAVV